MQFLKTLLWIAVAVLVALFAIRNGAPVTVNLWSDLQMVTPLWVIVVLSFLAGLVPTLALHRASRWRWRRRLEQAERALTDSHPAEAPAVAGTAHVPGDEPFIPAAGPIVPPSAGN